MNWIDTKKNVSFNKKLNHFSISIFHTTRIYTLIQLWKGMKNVSIAKNMTWPTIPAILLFWWVYVIVHLKGEEFALQKNISVDFPLWYFACCFSLSISYIIRLVVWSRIFLRLSHLFKLSFPLTCLELSLFHHSLSTLFSDSTTVISFTQIKYTIPFTYGLHWV